MPIVVNDISSQIQTLIKNNTETDPAKGQKKFADGLAAIIADAIKSADIVVPAGIPVTTAGSPTAQSGATTAPAKATID